LNTLEIIDHLRKKDLIYEINRVLSCRYEASKEISKADKEKRTVLFRVDCAPSIDSISNIISSRDVLKEFLGVRDDKELYRKISDALNNPLKITYEENFKDHYTVIENDLTKLPAIYFYERDGGRYTTSSIFIAKDPYEEKYNASIHRVMILGRDSCVARIVPRHLYRIVTENRRRSRETPVAICYTSNPLIELGASLQPEYGVFEIEVANRLMGGGLRICRTPIHNLPVPCECSHVIEARITLEDHEEGPFTDILLTYDIVRREPLIKIDSIYMNKMNYPFNIILPGGREHRILMSIGKEADIYYAVSRVVRRVHKVRLTDGSGSWLHIVISIEKNHDGDAKNAVMAAFAAHPSAKIVVVVDEDIDPDDPEQVDWAIATRFQASKGLIVVSGARLSSLDPSSKDGLGDKLGIDATTPLTEKKRFERARIPE